MNKIKLALIIFILSISAFLIVLGLRAWLGREANQPPSASLKSATANVEIWVGRLILEQKAEFEKGDGKIDLKIGGADALEVLKGKGFKTGDNVEIMGKISNGAVEMSGLRRIN